ncbi:MAG: condensation domain-containing protein, partial [bacterium]
MTDVREQLAALGPAERSALIHRLRELRAGTPQRASPPLRRRNLDVAPLAPVQERLWVLAQIAPENGFYNVPIALRIRGNLAPVALQVSIDALVRRHETLRTTFRTVNGAPMQVVTPDAPALRCFDLSELPESQRECALKRCVNEEANLPFDLATEPSFRAKLIRLANDDHALLLTLHHLVADDRSVAILHRDLAFLYADAIGSENAHPLPTLTIQYADVAAWQNEWLAEGEAAAQLAYWRSRLPRDLASAELPSDRRRPAMRTYAGESWFEPLPSVLAERLTLLARHEGATLFMALLAVFQTLLHRYSGSARVVVGSPIGARPTRETDELIGCFVNMLALDLDLSDDPPFREAMVRVRDAAAGGFANADIPFASLVDALEAGRDPSRHPIFQCLFDLHADVRAAPYLPGLAVTSIWPDRLGAKFDLSLVMAQGDETFGGRWEYN